MRKILAITMVVLLTALAGISVAHSADTTGIPWSTAKNSHPASTLGTVNEAASGIVWSRHNLSTLSNWFQPYTDNDDDPEYLATTQICVFCHTPHHAADDNDNCGPITNRECAPDGFTYTPYEATYGQGSGGGTPAAASLVCLSCHDGITTFDSLINPPGSGSNTDGTATDLGWYWKMWNTSPGFWSPAQSLDHFSQTNCNGCHTQNASDRLNIGLGPGYSYASKIVDLTNDHPIGMPYPSHTSGYSYYTLRPKSTVLSSITHPNNRSHTVGRSDNYWAVAGYICEDCSIDDLLFGSTGTVECCTCHDVHFKNQTNDDPSLINSYNREGSSYYEYSVSGQFDQVIDGLFFRRVGGNSNSGVCRTCHAKG